ncbi:hypothetical protein TEA_014471 [Camellia sinensis var. sinensis]|uniref:HIT domain-containing protein n=1 Tax=Camellia sinensis var. sinensis TaxID=542762 RepID=A0A4S4EI26_CAMSN|nr:hypothetical protein TEA_014471 [Camellia sinensis var. sinensis]
MVRLTVDKHTPGTGSIDTHTEQNHLVNNGKGRKAAGGVSLLLQLLHNIVHLQNQKPPPHRHHFRHQRRRRLQSSFTHRQSFMNSELYTFGPYKITPKEVFYSTDLCFAMVNLRPVVPGSIDTHTEQNHLVNNGKGRKAAGGVSLLLQLLHNIVHLQNQKPPPHRHHFRHQRRRRLQSSFTHRQSFMNSELYTFGPYKITPKEVFYSTDLCFAMVNLRPVVPDYNTLLFLVLLSSVKIREYEWEIEEQCIAKRKLPWREVKRFVDLTAEETVDMWLTAQKVGSRLENYHKASSLTLTIQDGPQAGQTVPHVHIHILPRKSGDFEKSDDAYDAIDEKEKELKQKLDLDKERKDRTLEEMSEEADEYRRLLS